MMRRAFRRSFLCSLLAALLLFAGDASAHGVDPLAGAETAHPGESENRPSPPRGEITVDKAALEDMIVHAVGRAVAQQRGGGSELRDIVGGLGWIIGLLGLAAYMKYRRQTRG